MRHKGRCLRTIMFTNINETDDALYDPVNFESIWEEENLSPCTTVREMTLDEFQSEYEIDPSVFHEEFEFRIEPALDNKFDEEMGQNHENHRKETHSPSVAKSSSENSCKFVDLSESDVQTLIQEQSNKGTLKKTLCDIKKFENFLKSKNGHSEMSKLEPEKLDQYLANFILSIRKADRHEYEPSTLRDIVSSLDRKLKRQKYPHQIMNSSTPDFQLSRDALKAKQKSLKNKEREINPTEHVLLPITRSTCCMKRVSYAATMQKAS